MAPHIQDEVQAHSLGDPESFWAHQAEQLHWHKKPSKALERSTRKLASGVEHPSFTWFPNGEISTSYNCIDRHVKSGNGEATAIIWDSPVTGSKERYSYNQLLAEVETLAGVLREEGVKKGDVVLVYSKYRSGVIFYSCSRNFSANDTCCSLWNSRCLSPWRYACSSIWRICTSFISATDRSVETSSYSDSILWY